MGVRVPNEIKRGGHRVGRLTDWLANTDRPTSRPTLHTHGGTWLLRNASFAPRDRPTDRPTTLHTHACMHPSRRAHTAHGDYTPTHMVHTYIYIGGLLVDLPRRLRAVPAAHPARRARRPHQGLPQVSGLLCCAVPCCAVSCFLGVRSSIVGGAWACDMHAERVMPAILSPPLVLV